MNAWRCIGRRDVLLASVAFIAASLGAWATAPVPDARKVAEAVVAALFNDRTGARAVGRAYLALAGPDEQSPAGVLRALFAAHGFARRPGEAVDDLTSRTRSWIERDFARGVVVNLDGWMVSLTEARLAALATLLA